MTSMLFLHGATGSAKQMQDFQNILGTRVTQSYCIDFSGHGASESIDEFSFTRFVHDIKVALDTHKIEKAVLVGYSMGGYAAICAAMEMPERIEAVVCYNTKFLWTEATAERQCRMLVAEKIKEKVPKWASALQKEHGDKWESVLEKTAAMLRKNALQNWLSLETLKTVSCPVLVGVGDRDTTAETAENLLVAQTIPKGQFFALPNASHDLRDANLEVIELLVERFLALHNIL